MVNFLSVISLMLLGSIWVVIGTAEKEHIIKQLNTLEEIDNFRKNIKVTGIFFYRQEEDKKIKSRTLSAMKQAIYSMNNLDKHYIKLAKVNCNDKKIEEANMEECSHGKRVFYAYQVKNDFKQQYDIQELFTLESFEAHMIEFANNDVVGVYQSRDDFEDALRESRGTKDILFLYLMGLGSRSHHQISLFILDNREQYNFALSNEVEFVNELFNTTIIGESSLWYLKCKKLSEHSNEMCEYVRYLSNDSPNLYMIEQFVQNVDTPVIENIKENEVIPKGVHGADKYIYAICDSEEDQSKMASMLHEAMLLTLLSDYRILGRIVNINKHKNYMNTLGIVTTDILPTFVYEYTTEEGTLLNQFSPDDEINTNNLANFMTEMLTNIDQYAAKMSDIYHIECMSLEQWKQTKSEVPRLVCGCSNSEKMCQAVNMNYRRLVRTLTIYSIADIENYYVDFTGKPKSTKLNDIPSIKYLVPNSEEEIVFNVKGLATTDDMYTELLKWMNKILKTDMKLIPLSNVDLVELPPPSSGEELNNQYLDDLDSFQNDEISKDANKNIKKRIVYSDSVPKLTDKNYQQTINETKGLVVVLFYIDYDDRSFLFQPRFNEIRNMLAKSAPEVSLFKVDCYQQYITCNRHQQITTFPIIRIFKNSEKLADYTGILVESSLLQAILLYKQPTLLELTDVTLPHYSKGEKNFELSSKVGVAFFGLFQAKDKDFEIYKQQAEENYGKYSFAYMITKDGGETLQKGKTFPIIKAYIRNDELRESEEMRQPFTADSLKTFIARASIPLMGELNPLNFPRYKSLGVPFVLLFGDQSVIKKSAEYKILQLAAKKDSRDSILYAWMDTELKVVRNIRRNYVGATKRLMDIVLVNHANGDVFLYTNSQIKDSNEEVIAQDIQEWLRKCEKKDLRPISHLNRQKFKPLHEGFNFLHFIDNNIGGVEGKELGQSQQGSRSRLRIPVSNLPNSPEQSVQLESNLPSDQKESLERESSTEPRTTLDESPTFDTLHSVNVGSLSEGENESEDVGEGGERPEGSDDTPISKRVYRESEENLAKRDDVQEEKSGIPSNEDKYTQLRNEL